MSNIYIDHNLSGEQPYGWVIEFRPSNEWILNEVSPSHSNRDLLLTWRKENKRIYNSHKSALNAFIQMSKPIGEKINPYFERYIFRIIPIYSKSASIDKDPLEINTLITEPPLRETKIKMTEKKTSAEWINDPIYKDVAVLDPDGWDRTNFKYSWNIELITESEFITRLFKSTLMMSGDANSRINNRSIDIMNETIN